MLSGIAMLMGINFLTMACSAAMCSGADRCHYRQESLMPW